MNLLYIIQMIYFVRLIDDKYHRKTIDHLDNDIEDMA